MLFGVLLISVVSVGDRPINWNIARINDGVKGPHITVETYLNLPFAVHQVQRYQVDQ